MGSMNVAGYMAWQYIHDPKRQKIHSFNFNIDYKNKDRLILYNDYTETYEDKNIYNTFIRPPATFTDENIVLKQCELFFNYLECIICSGDVTMYDMIKLDWYMFQKGGTKLPLYCLVRKVLARHHFQTV